MTAPTCAEILQAAMSYSQRGWHFFPLAPYSKVPFKDTNGKDDATANLEEFAGLLDSVARGGEANLGGLVPKGVLYLDIDKKDGKDGAATLRARAATLPGADPAFLEDPIGWLRERYPTQRSWSGYWHFLMRYPAGTVPRRKPCGDAGGIECGWGDRFYLVLDPSFVIDNGSSGRYSGEDDWPPEPEEIPDVPGWLLPLLCDQREPEPPEDSQPGQDRTRIPDAARRDLAAVVGALSKLGRAAVKRDGGPGWISVLIAAHSVLERHGSRVARALYDLVQDWSRCARGENYDEAAVRKRWGGLRGRAEGEGLGIGSLVMWSREAEEAGCPGWEEMPERWRELVTPQATEFLSGEYVRPVIRISTDVPRMVDEAEAALLAHPDVQLFQRGRLLVRVVRAAGHDHRKITRPEGSPLIEPMPDAALFEQLARAAEWQRYRKTERRYGPALPPQYVVHPLASRARWRFPLLEGVTESPTLRPDGTILENAGYDEASAILFDPGGVVFPAAPARPTLEDAKQALRVLREPFSEFPFVEAHHLDATVAAVLTVIARQAIPGAVPLFAVTATAPGTGKTLLVIVCALIPTGRIPAVTTPTIDGNEMRKLLLALAIEGAPIVLLDNVETALGNAELAAALTGEEITGRVLGLTRTATAPLRAVWFATGNGLQFRGDLGRRVIPIGLDAEIEDPEARDFERPDLKAWVQERRPSLVMAGLTLLSAYIRAGRPPHGLSPMGSFEGWDALVRGAVIWAGGADPCEGRDAVRRDADEDLERLRCLLHAWRAAFGAEGAQGRRGDQGG